MNSMSKLLIGAILLVGVVYTSSLAGEAMAQTLPPGQTVEFNLPPGNPSGTSDGSVALPCPLGSKADCQPTAVIGNIINVVLGLVGSLALIMFVYGGLIWMTSAGNKERITTGRNTLIWAVLGLVVIFSSYAVINFVLRVGFNQQ